nr:hypothetical protein [Mycoplasmoides pneumoniae]
MMTQGPNLIGIHTITKENEETQKFVNWFLNTSLTWDNNESKTPAQYFTESASYILPLKETFTGSNNKGQSGKNDGKNSNNTFKAKALELFKEQSENKIVGYSDPSDFRGGKFRESIGSAFNATVNSHVDFNTFVANFRANLGSGYDK